MYILTLMLILPKGFLNKLKICSLFIITIIFIFNFNDNFSKRMINVTMYNINSFVLNYDHGTKKNILSLSRMHDDHYASGFEMFKDNILFGQGPKMFRIKCKENRFNVAKWSCSSHPHNIIIQFLAELGLVGTLFLIYFYLSLFLNIKKAKNKPLIILTTFLVFLIFFPLLPFGNFFHNGLVIMNILSISILWCLYNGDNEQY